VKGTLGASWSKFKVIGLARPIIMDSWLDTFASPTQTKEPILDGLKAALKYWQSDGFWIMVSGIKPVVSCFCENDAVARQPVSLLLAFNSPKRHFFYLLSVLLGWLVWWLMVKLFCGRMVSGQFWFNSNGTGKHGNGSWSVVPVLITSIFWWQ